MALPPKMQRTKNGWLRTKISVPKKLRTVLEMDVFIRCHHTRDVAVALPPHRRALVEFDGLIAGAGKRLENLSKGLLRASDAELLAARFEAMLIHSDDDERSNKLSAEEPPPPHPLPWRPSGRRCLVQRVSAQSRLVQGERPITQG